jgi:hypothetical protein
MRSRTQEKLVELRAQDYDSEELLQRLLADHPHLIAGQQIDESSPRRWLFITREMGVPGEDAAAAGGRSITSFWTRMGYQPSSR